MHPFSRELWLLAVPALISVGLCYPVNYLYLPAIPSAMLKTMIIAGVFASGAYWLRLSPEWVGVVNKYSKKIKWK